MSKLAKGLIQAYEVQDFVFASLQALKSTLFVDGQLRVTREDAQAIAVLVKSWQAAQEQVRIGRRVPLPGSLTRPERKLPKPRGRRQSTSIEQPTTLDTQPVVVPEQ